MALQIATLIAGYSDVYLTIPFNEIVAGATVRVAVINGVQYLSIRDLIMHLCGKDSKQAPQIWINLSGDVKHELSPFCKTLQFPGQGQTKQPVITFPGALRLIMYLPGDTAKKHRAAMVTILHRYFAGDPSQLKDIQANASSGSVVASGSIIDSALIDVTGSQEAIDECLDRKRKRELADAHLHTVQLKNVEIFMTTMTAINPNWREDTELRLKTEEWLKQVAFNKPENPPGITVMGTEENHETPVQYGSRNPISLNQVAKSMGQTLTQGQLSKIGSAVAKNYRAKYGVEPPKHLPGRPDRKKMLYTERDRILVEQAITDFIKHRSD